MTPNFAKTKILATLGPATSSLEKIQELVDAGIDGIRLNFSHGTYEDFDNMFKMIEEICSKNSLPVSVLQDLQGPKIRVGDLIQDEIELKTGNSIEITPEEIKGSEKLISTTYKDLPKDAQINDKILLDDGLIELRVTEKKENSLVCEIVEGGILRPRKGMNLPGMKLSTPSITDKDLQDLDFALDYRVDFIALSFIRSAEDIVKLRDWLRERGHNKYLIAKIEKKEAVDNFEDILKVADGIMVARGDLGVELRPQAVPVIQKQIIKRCNEVGKFVITATQMLESMINNPIPTRAEASDVANAVWDGTNVVMLSGETSVGKYPIETVEIMNDILLNTEKPNTWNIPINYEVPQNLEDNLFDSTGRAVVDISNQVKASLIVVFTHYGRKAKMIAKFRPEARIIAISDNFETLNILNLYWGIKPYYSQEIDDSDKAIELARDILAKENLLNDGDIIIYTAGAPMSDKGRFNWVRFAVA